MVEDLFQGKPPGKTNAATSATTSVKKSLPQETATTQGLPTQGKKPFQARRVSQPARPA